MQLRRHRRKRTLHLISWACILTGIILPVVGGILAWNQIKADDTDEKPVSHQVDNGNTHSPISVEKPKPSEFDLYTVASDLPRYLFIPKISVKAMIKPVGLTKDDRIDVPKNAFDVGWYTGSSKPGTTGTLLVDGHVSGGPTPGVFYNLKDLQENDILVLERGDSTQLTYRVMTTREYDISNVDMNAALAPISNKPGLNLITCTGNVMKGTNNYTKRLVVFTEQL